MKKITHYYLSKKNSHLKTLYVPSKAILQLLIFKNKAKDLSHTHTHTHIHTNITYTYTTYGFDVNYQRVVTLIVRLFFLF